ncbi:MAG: ParB/RepB/Spo0J family partition protein [Bacteroidales bacterium]|jgi:ParB family chromosome partitioning protein|nr:ParB/RepB/Spo0J family partition protein [Bacteroidales bacterium]
MAKRIVLPRGIEDLLGIGADVSAVATPDDEQESVVVRETALGEIPIDAIEANPQQPRTRFDDSSLNELAASIREVGIIQPLTVRKVDDAHYQLIAGERRYRAAKLAGLTTVPAYVRQAAETDMQELALIENIQREDLDAIDIALSYQRLVQEHNYTQDELSVRVGKKRATIANYLRLLKLPADIQKGIIEKAITMGHARALITVPSVSDQMKLYRQIIQEDLSVRKTEELARKLSDDDGLSPAKLPLPEKEKYPAEYDDLKVHLCKLFGTSIDFSLNEKGKGKIVIPFGTTKDFERILEILDKLWTLNE